MSKRLPPAPAPAPARAPARAPAPVPAPARAPALSPPLPVRILGLDPGTLTAGFSVLDADSGSRPRLIAAGAIRLRGEGLPERLKLLHEALQELIATHQPQVLAVETVFHGRSFDSVLKVGEARGVALLAAALHGLEVREYSPAEVKKTVTGNGRASKQQVQRMVARLLDLKTAPEPSDVADALAVAFCYAQRLWRRRLPPAEETPLRLALRELRGRRRRGAGQLSDGVRRLLERQGYTTGGVRRER